MVRTPHRSIRVTTWSRIVWWCPTFSNVASVAAPHLAGAWQCPEYASLRGRATRWNQEQIAPSGALAPRRTCIGCRSSWPFCRSAWDIQSGVTRPSASGVQFLNLPDDRQAVDLAVGAQVCQQAFQCRQALPRPGVGGWVGQGQHGGVAAQLQLQAVVSRGCCCLRLFSRLLLM